MKYLTCGANGTVEEAMNTIQFWSENSFQHIDTLLAQNGESEYFNKNIENQLSNISKEFKGYYKSSKSRNQLMQINKLMKEFVSTNSNLIEIFQRLKFEGLNGYPLLYQEIYHFIYEQLYINCLFKNYVAIKPMTNTSVIINAIFNEKQYYKNKMHCTYSTLYFWSLIGAEHSSIIETSIPNGMMLPKKTKDMFLKFKQDFNTMNFDLSQMYDDMNKTKLDMIERKFLKLNKEFLEFLNAIKTQNALLFPNLENISIPSMFDGLLEHIISEHKYIKEIFKE